MKNFFKKCIPAFVQDKQLSKVYYIHGEEVRPVAQIAQGSYAFVYTLSRNDLVLKHMIIQTQEAFQEALNEVNVLYTLRNNQNINKVFHLFIGGKEINLNNLYQESKGFSLPLDFDIFLEKCNCTLLDYINKHPSFLQENELWHLAGGILSALSAVTAAGLIDRDLKAENVLLASSTPTASSIRLCDLGSTTSESFAGENILKNGSLRARLEAEISSKTTPQYRAPELIDLFARLPVGPQQDVFSFGVTLYRLMYKRLPFPEGELLANFNVKFTFPDEVEINHFGQQSDEIPPPKYSHELKDLVRRSLVKDPRQRATVFQLVQLVEAKIGKFGAETEPSGFSEQIKQFGAPGLSNTAQVQNQTQNNTQTLIQTQNAGQGSINPFAGFQMNQNFAPVQTINNPTQSSGGFMDLLDWGSGTGQQNAQQVSQVQPIVQKQQENNVLDGIWGYVGTSQEGDLKKLVDKVIFVSCANLGSPEYGNNAGRIEQLLYLCKYFLSHSGMAEDQKLLEQIHKHIQEMIDQNKQSLDINKDVYLHLLKDMATLFQVSVQYCVITQYIQYNQTTGFVITSKQQFQAVQQAIINLVNLVYGLSILVQSSQYLQHQYNEIRTYIVEPSIKLAQNCCKKEVELTASDLTRLQAEYQNIVGKEVFGIAVKSQLQANSGEQNIINDVFGF